MSMNYSEKENQFLNISNYTDNYKHAESYFLKFLSGEKMWEQLTEIVLKFQEIYEHLRIMSQQRLGLQCL